MPAGAAARRLASCLRPRFTRRARGLLCLWLAGLSPAAEVAAEIASARYVEPTRAYGHGVLPGGEYARLEIRLRDGRRIRSTPERAVYEDTAPRLVDLDGDGTAEVITVISYFDQGAALRIWDEVSTPDPPGGSSVAVVAETPPIGRPHRWLAVIGAADLDGDGEVEIAYVDRPHLARILRIWRFRNGALTEVASRAGYSNHRIGDAGITSGLRDCGLGPELVVPDGDWRRIKALRLQDGELGSRDLGPLQPDIGLRQALRCQ
ncbi:VCBS repeat-containing protein [Nocardioides marinus]|nr:VCBS repeat-containing protein [Nocardioides marinus]